MRERCVARFHQQVQNATEDFIQFQTTCSRLSSLQSSLQREELSEAEEQALQKFFICRKFSTLLYQQLRQACPEHPEHQVYFNLQVSETLDQPIPELSFHLAFETTKLSKDDPGLVWFRAQSTLFAFEAEDVYNANRRDRKKPKSILHRRSFKNAGPANAKTKTPTFARLAVGDANASYLTEMQAPLKVVGSICLANLRQHTRDWAADLPDLMDKGSFTVGQNRLYYPEVLPDVDSHPVRLSQWIDEKRYMDFSSKSIIELNLVQIKVARLLCEAVLRFTPRLWSQTSFSSDQLLIVDRTARGDLEPHLSVRLDKWSLSEPSPTRQRVSVPCGEILLRIGVILLEIAHLRLIKGLRVNVAGEIDRTDPSFSVVRNLCGDSLQRQFGRSDYAKAVDYCVDFSRSGMDILNRDFQEDFYQVVVVSLEKIERNLNMVVDMQKKNR